MGLPAATDFRIVIRKLTSTIRRLRVHRVVVPDIYLAFRECTCNSIYRIPERAPSDLDLMGCAGLN